MESVGEEVSTEVIGVQVLLTRIDPELQFQNLGVFDEYLNGVVNNFRESNGLAKNGKVDTEFMAKLSEHLK